MIAKRWLGRGVLGGGLLLGEALLSVGGGHGSRAMAQDVIDLDEDEDAEPELAPSRPTQAGPMSSQAAKAKQLFDAEQWEPAALALFEVASGGTQDDAGNQQLAQYYLSISLFQMKLYQASFALFGLVSQNRNHIKFAEALLWLAKLATELPEPADVIEQVGHYSGRELGAFDNDKQKDLFYQVSYMLGRYKYRNQQFEEAVRLFNQVGSGSAFYLKAQFLAGISYVQLRKSVPAVKSFQRVIAAIESGDVSGGEDVARYRDLAYLQIARTLYTASIRLDPETNAPDVDAAKLSTAVLHWNQIDTSSEYWLSALFEESWAYYMAGQHPKALGNIHTLRSPYFPGAFYPEAEVVKAVIYFQNCDYEAATTVVARFNKRFVPIQEELQKVLSRFEGERQAEPFFKFLVSVREGSADLAPSIAGIVEASLSDRQLLRGIEYVRVLDRESQLFESLGGSFKGSDLGEQVRGVLKVARELAVQSTGDLARSRYQRNLEELDEHLRNGEKILIDITAAQRNELDQAIAANQVSRAESRIFGRVRPDEEHMLWPFEGEFWRDELGFYRQVVESACGR